MRNVVAKLFLIASAFLSSLINDGIYFAMVYIMLHWSYFFAEKELQHVVLTLARNHDQSFQLLMFIDSPLRFFSQPSILTSFWNVVDNFIRTRDEVFFVAYYMVVSHHWRFGEMCLISFQNFPRSLHSTSTCHPSRRPYSDIMRWDNGQTIILSR